MKNLLITSLFLLLTAGTYGQSTTYQSDKPRGGIHKLLSKRAYTGQYPLPNFPKATPSSTRSGYDALGQPLNFPDRVWFPGEWEEVKAIVVSPLYYHLVPKHEDDNHYAA